MYGVLTAVHHGFGAAGHNLERECPGADGAGEIVQLRLGAACLEPLKDLPHGSVDTPALSPRFAPASPTPEKTTVS